MSFTRIGIISKYTEVCFIEVILSCIQHRRIDLIFIPANEWACSLLYFTGSAMFNRSMRRLARRLNMSLSQHGLCRGVVRKVYKNLFIQHLVWIYLG
jgi:DNA polymerase/3'-5' exonuclease PolX